MKSRCAPMSAEDRQAHHLFISHHCRITARCLPRLVGCFVVRGIILHHQKTLPIVRDPRFFLSYSSYWSYQSHLPPRYPISRNLGSHFITRNPRFFLVFVLLVVSVPYVIPIPFVIPKLPTFPKPRLISLSSPISPNPKPYIFPKLGVSLSSFRNSEHPYAFAKLCGRSRIPRNLIRLFFLFALFGIFAF